MRAVRFAVLAFVPVFACNSSGGGPADTGVDAGSADVVVAVDAGGDEEATTSPVCERSAPTETGTMHGGSVSQPETWTKAGSPYRLPYDTEITAPLTLEACTTVFIGAQRTITVTGAGSIVAKGTEIALVYLADANQGNWASIRALSGGTLSFEWTQIYNGGIRSTPSRTSPPWSTSAPIRPSRPRGSFMRSTRPSPGR